MYEWIKALHISFMVTWFAGLFYLPRLFVYHAMADDQIGQARFKVMERKLFYGITTPGGFLTIVFGVWLIHIVGAEALFSQPWFLLKLAIVALLVAYHVYLAVIVRRFRHRQEHAKPRILSLD